MISAILKLLVFIFLIVVFVLWIISICSYKPKDDECPYNDCYCCPFPCDKRKDS